jgi:uncharacterized membrane protein YdjX (TVP38/TMEM64 family)
MPPNPRTLAVLILVSALVALAAAVICSRGWVDDSSQAEAALALAHKYEATNWLTLAGLQLIAVISGVVPASLVGMAAGALFGVGGGFAISSVGILVGALGAFGLSRSAFRPLLERAMHGRNHMRNLDAALGRDGWKLVCLLRVSPLMPFVATSYMLGLSAVTLRDYTLGTLAALPALLGYVMLGALAKASISSSSGASGPLRWTLLLLGFGATAIMITRVGGLVMKVANAVRPEQAPPLL